MTNNSIVIMDEINKKLTDFAQQEYVFVRERKRWFGRGYKTVLSRRFMYREIFHRVGTFKGDNLEELKKLEDMEVGEETYIGFTDGAYKFTYSLVKRVK